MPDQETIREFVARIGYKVDEPSERRFFAGMEGAVLKANLLADALEGMARIAVEKVGQTAEYLERLGYMSARLGADAVHIRAFGQAFQQAGGTVEQGIGLLEKFAQWRAKNVTTGANSFLRNLFGIDPKESSDQALVDIGKRLDEMKKRDPNAGAALGLRFAEAIGASYEDVQVLLRSGVLQRFLKEGVQSGELAGIGPGMTAGAAKFEQSLRDFWNRIDNMSVGGEGKLTEALIGPMDKLDAWIAKNEPALDQGIGKITDAVGRMTSAFVDDFTKVRWDDDANQIVSFADGVAKFIDQIHGFIIAMEDLNERSKSWWIMRLLNKDVHLDANGQPEFLGGDQGSESSGGWWGGIKRFFGFGGGGGGGGGGPAGSNPGKGEYDVTKAYDLIKSVGGTDEEAQVLAAIAQPESGGNPRSHNTKGLDNSYGLWQINMLGNLGPERLRHFGLRSYDDLFDPKTNARVALQMAREAHGYKDWSTYRSGAYRPYLKGYRPYLTPDKPFSAPALPKVGGDPSRALPKVGGDPGPDPRNWALRNVGLRTGRGGYLEPASRRRAARGP